MLCFDLTDLPEMLLVVDFSRLLTLFRCDLPLFLGEEGFKLMMNRLVMGLFSMGTPERWRMSSDLSLTTL